MIAAARIFSLLDRKPKIDSAAGSGLRLNEVDGDAEFKDAVFSYPTRKTVRVLQGLDLEGCRRSSTRAETEDHVRSQLVRAATWEQESSAVAAEESPARESEAVSPSAVTRSPVMGAPAADQPIA